MTAVFDEHIGDVGVAKGTEQIRSEHSERVVSAVPDENRGINLCQTWGNIVVPDVLPRGSPESAVHPMSGPTTPHGHGRSTLGPRLGPTRRWDQHMGGVSGAGAGDNQ